MAKPVTSFEKSQPRPKARPAASTYVLNGQTIDAPQLAPGLHVVATPIGHLEDITLRALNTLAGASRIACEDTRVTAKLLNRYGIRKPMIPYHEHNMRACGEKLMAYMQNGEAIALVSDAGTPLLSDPGAELVRQAADANVEVTPYPGASALLAALVVSGIAAAPFHFIGFLPPKQGARRKALDAWTEVPGALIFYETAPRLAASLADMVDILGAREAAICRELTKMHETIVRGDLQSLAAQFANETTKGEIVIVVGASSAEAEAIDIAGLLQEAMKNASLKEAVALVARQSGAARRDVYAEALRLKDEA